jgi:MoaA/NifB/PqqE/SkfB family radical SAM enzyme
MEAGDFVVLCGNSVLDHFRRLPGFRGAVYIDKKPLTDGILLTELPQAADTILVQNSPQFCAHIFEKVHLLGGRRVMVFPPGSPGVDSLEPAPTLENESASRRSVGRKWDVDEIQEAKLSNLRLMRQNIIDQSEIAVCLPGRIWMESSTRCNFRCPMCYNTFAMPGGGKDMSLAVFDEVKTALFPYLTLVDLQGQGEPLMSQHFNHFYNTSIEYGIKPSMVTNGSLLTHRRLDRFVADGVQLFLSMDGITPETYNLLRPGYDVRRLVEKINYACKRRDELGDAGFSVNFICIATRKTAHGIPLLVEAAVAWKARTFTLSALAGEHLDKQMIENLVIDPVKDTEAVAHLDSARRIAKASGMLLLLPPGYGRSESVARMPEMLKRIADRVKPGNTKYPGICTRPWSHTWISQDGTVRVCCAMPEPMGNLREKSLFDIWNGPQYLELRRYVNTDNPPSACEKCKMPFGINSKGTGLPVFLADGRLPVYSCDGR